MSSTNNNMLYGALGVAATVTAAFGIWYSSQGSS